MIASKWVSAASVPQVRPGDPSVVIWLLCHYPDTAEADVRVEKAAQLHWRLDLPIWLYGSNSARYQDSVEHLIKRKLIHKGIGADAVICSSDHTGNTVSLDTVQEAYNVARESAYHRT